MENYPEGYRYNAEHTWLSLEGDNHGRVGVTFYAQERLREVVFVELPEIGTEVNYLEPFGVNFQKSSYTNCNITFVWSNNTFPIKQMISAFEDNNIEYRTRYSPYDYINERKMKMSMKMYKHGLCLPSYPGIDYKYIVKVIKKRLKKHEN